MSADQHLVDILVDAPFIHRVDVDNLRRCVQQTLASRKLRTARVVSLRLTDSRTVRRLNRRYRGEDASTDVLSFNVEFEGLRRPDGAAELGELIIAVPIATRGARARNRSLAEELALLTVHGTLHLLGFDHEEPAEDARMKLLEQAALARVGMSSAARV